MVTQRGREEFARNAVAKFEAQTYDNKELVIVQQETYLPPGILEGEKVILGELRNEAVRRAKGQIVIQWDDDDLYGSQRIEKQIEGIDLDGGRLVGSVLHQLILKCVCGFTTFTQDRLWENTVAVRRDVALSTPYRQMASGEDTAFVQDILDKGLLFKVVKDPSLYTYRMHMRNTCATAHWDNLFRNSPMVDATRHYPSKCWEESLEQLDISQLQRLALL